MSISFIVPYPGAAASSNHGYAPAKRYSKRLGREYLGLRLVPEASEFKELVVWLAKEAIIYNQWHPTPGTPLIVTLRGRFPDKRHSDVSNLAKYIVDSIEEALNCYVDRGPRHNDRDWSLTVLAPYYEAGEPMIEVKVAGEA